MFFFSHAWLASRSPHVLPLCCFHGLGRPAPVLAGTALLTRGIGDPGCFFGLRPPMQTRRSVPRSCAGWVWNRSSSSAAIRSPRQTTFASWSRVRRSRWMATAGRTNRWAKLLALSALPTALASEEIAARAYKRPVKIMKLGSDAAPLAKGGRVGYDDLKDFAWLFAPNRDWVVAVTSQSSRGIAYA